MLTSSERLSNIKFSVSDGRDLHHGQDCFQYYEEKHRMIDLLTCIRDTKFPSCLFSSNYKKEMSKESFNPKTVHAGKSADMLIIE